MLRPSPVTGLFLIQGKRAKLLNGRVLLLTVYRMCFNGALCHSAALIKRQLVCFLLALKPLGLYQLWLGLTTEACEPLKGRRFYSYRSPGRLTFQMLPEAVGLQTRFSPDGVERKVFVTGRHHMP